MCTYTKEAGGNFKLFLFCFRAELLSSAALVFLSQGGTEKQLMELCHEHGDRVNADVTAAYCCPDAYRRRNKAFLQDTVKGDIS